MSESWGDNLEMVARNNKAVTPIISRNYSFLALVRRSKSNQHINLFKLFNIYHDIARSYPNKYPQNILILKVILEKQAFRRALLRAHSQTVYSFFRYP